MVEDLNDDDIMELCIFSNELNACETAAILNPSKFASRATRLEQKPTMWDLSLEDDRAELRRVQNREQPELLAGSSPGDDFSSLLNTCVESQQISKLKTERIEPQIRACVQAYKLQVAEVLRVDGRWKRDKRHVHMTGKSETASEYPASLVVAMLSAIKRQMISDAAIRVGELHFAGPVPDEGDYPTELEGKWRVDGTWIDPKLLNEGRKEEMEYMRKMGVFEVVR